MTMPLAPAPLAKGRGEKMSKAEAGRKGGKKTAKRYGKRYMRKLGKWGAHRLHATYRLEPVDLNDFALVHRVTGKVKAYLSGKEVNGNQKAEGGRQKAELVS